MRLIDADAKALKDRININFGAVTRYIVKSILKDAPTVDAVPVVRCVECKHRDPENHHCDHPAGSTIYFPRKDDDFCSYGERKEDKND